MYSILYFHIVYCHSICFVGIDHDFHFSYKYDNVTAYPVCVCLCVNLYNIMSSCSIVFCVHAYYAYVCFHRFYIWMSHYELIFAYFLYVRLIQYGIEMFM